MGGFQIKEKWGGNGCYRSTERESGRIGTRASPSTWNKLEEKKIDANPTTFFLKEIKKKKKKTRNPNRNPS